MITVISGTNREGSNTYKIARHVAKLHEEMGADVTFLDLVKLPAEVFTPQAYGEKPDIFKSDFTDHILNADGLVILTPEYNGSFPGVLKYFIDMLPFPDSFENRPVAFIGLAAGYYGGLRPVEQLQQVFAYRNAYVFNKRVFIPGVGKVVDDEGHIQDKDILQRLEDQAAKFQAFIKSLSNAG